MVLFVFIPPYLFLFHHWVISVIFKLHRGKKKYRWFHLTLEAKNKYRSFERSSTSRVFTFYAAHWLKGTEVVQMLGENTQLTLFRDCTDLQHSRTACSPSERYQTNIHRSQYEVLVTYNLLLWAIFQDGKTTHTSVCICLYVNILKHSGQPAYLCSYNLLSLPHRYVEMCKYSFGKFHCWHFVQLLCSWGMSAQHCIKLFFLPKGTQ